jgi:hypothetical protein
VPIVGTVVVRTPFSTRSRERTDVRDGFDLGAGDATGDISYERAGAGLDPTRIPNYLTAYVTNSAKV